MQKETSPIHNNTDYNASTLWIHLPFQLLEYLSDGYALKKPGRFSKLKAFIDLVSRQYRNTDKTSGTTFLQQNETGVNISRLSKEWGWSRLTVSQFVGELQKMGIAQTRTSRLGNFVFIKPDIIQQVSCAQKMPDGLEGIPIQLQAALSESSSSEVKEGISVDKKFFEK